MKLIIGLTGQIASGKGTVAKYLVERHNASVVKFSDILREILRSLALLESRENIQKISTSVRNLFGEDILARAVAARAGNIKDGIIVVDGVRRLDDIKYLSGDKNFILVAVEADIQRRYERLTKRGENSDDLKKTFEEFVADHNYETELTIKDVEQLAKIHLNNNGSPDDLYAQLDKLIGTAE